MANVIMGLRWSDMEHYVWVLIIMIQVLFCLSVQIRVPLLTEWLRSDVPWVGAATQNWKTNVSDFVYYSQLGDLRVEREEMEEMLYREEGGAMIEQYQYQSNYPGLVVGVSWALGEYDRSLVSLGCLTINISSVTWHSLHPLPCLVM